MTLSEYLRLTPESRATIDAPGALDVPAKRYAKWLRDGAKRVEKLNVGIAGEMREAANFLATEGAEPS